MNLISGRVINSTVFSCLLIYLNNFFESNEYVIKIIFLYSYWKVNKNIVKW